MGSPATSSHHEHLANRLLAAIPYDCFNLLAPHLESVALPARTLLFDTGNPLQYVYFPRTGLVGLMAAPDEGGAEAATIGSEGFVGFEAVLGGTTTATRAMVQLGGSASRISLANLNIAIRAFPAIGTSLLRYVRYFLIEALQSAACNGMHTVEERFAKWLLLAQDRAGNGSTFHATQEFLAEMLGVHRPTMTIVARSLQSAGLIRYSRGVITVMDRKGLEGAACECYELMQQALKEVVAPP